MWDAIVTLRRQCARKCFFSRRASVIVNEEPAGNIRRFAKAPSTRGEQTYARGTGSFAVAFSRGIFRSTVRWLTNTEP